MVQNSVVCAEIAVGLSFFLPNGESKFIGETVTQFMIKVPIFKEKKCSYLYNSFVSV